jgi:superfamily II DNA or RNA helicase
MFFKDGVINRVKFDKIKRSNIFDIDNYNIIDYVVNKEFNIKQFSKSKSNLIIANMQYLIHMTQENRKIIKKNLKMIIFDECHNSNGDEIFDFITSFKNVIHLGFSATPLRNTKHKEKLLQLYKNPSTNKLNVISSYDIFDGIRDGVILPFKHYYFEFKNVYIKKKQNISEDDDSETIDDNSIDINNDNLDYNKSIIKNHIMPKIVSKLPYEKIVCWCKTKKIAKEWYNWFRSTYNDYKVYISISGEDENDDYLNFKKLEPIGNDKIKAILIVVGRVREGSDIECLDCGITVDAVKTRSVVVAMQTSGRVMRTDPSKLKEYACIIEGYLSIDNTSKQKLCADQILAYYQRLLQISEDKDNYKEKLSQLLKNTHFDNSSKLIRLKIDNHTNHDCILDIDVKEEDWSYIKKTITHYVKTRIDTNDKCDYTFSKINKCDIDNVQTKYIRYTQIIKYIYNLIKSPDTIKKQTTFNIVDGERDDKGFTYIKDLNISFQGQDANKCVKEIVTMCEKNNIKLEMSVQLMKNKNEQDKCCNIII